MTLFTESELAVLRASDRVVDQQEPGGMLDRRDRTVDRALSILREHERFTRSRRTVGAKTCPHGVAVVAVCDACPAWGEA